MPALSTGGFKKELELFNLHRVKHCRHLVVVESFFGAIRLHGLRIRLNRPKPGLPWSLTIQAPADDDRTAALSDGLPIFYAGPKLPSLPPAL